MNQKLVLASTSPYRKKLLEHLDVDFIATAPLCDEDKLKLSFSGSAYELCIHLAQKKAESLALDIQNSLIIGSDQALIFQDSALGKGKDFDGAFKQLSILSGKSALLVTATYILDQNGEDVFFECNTELNFKNLSEKDITHYLHLDKPYDCAGSFKFEENGKSLFTSVDTADETSIEGLPLVQLKKALTKKGIRSIR